MPITGTELDTIATDTSAGAGDAAKIVLLNASGLIDDSMLPATGDGDITGVTAGTGLTGGGTSGAVTLNVAYGTSSSTAAVGNDSRLSDSRTPTTHATSHKSGGSDSVKLDELAATTDVTTLNASTSAHGLLPKLSGDEVQYLNGEGEFVQPTQQTWYFFFDDESIHDVGQVYGDLAIITGPPPGNGKIYQYTDVWGVIGHIQSADATGTWTSGSSAASGGSNGNYYLRTTTGEISLKTSGTWNVIATFGSGTITGVTAGTGLTGGGTSGGVTLTVAYGSTGTTACAGNDSRLSDSRAPNGSASGDLGGSFPSPTVTQARGLKSATTTVAVSSATAPSAGQVLTATSTTAAEWSTPSTTATGVASATTTVSVSAATAPSTGQVLTATDSTHATWQAPTGGSASDLATTGANVNVSAAAPPSTGKVLMATDATHATWQTPAAGGGALNMFLDVPTSPNTDDWEPSSNANFDSTFVVYNVTAATVCTADSANSGNVNPFSALTDGTKYRRTVRNGRVLFQGATVSGVSQAYFIYKSLASAPNGDCLYSFVGCSARADAVSDGANATTATQNGLVFFNVFKTSGGIADASNRYLVGWSSARTGSTDMQLFKNARVGGSDSLSPSSANGKLWTGFPGGLVGLKFTAQTGALGFAIEPVSGALVTITQAADSAGSGTISAFDKWGWQVNTGNASAQTAPPYGTVTLGPLRRTAIYPGMT